MGSNGYEFVFFLKGYEDLCQDECVMQFFGLVNIFLVNDLIFFWKNFSIQRYVVIFLLINLGFIGWVFYCDILYVFIWDYREKKKIFFNIEYCIMLWMVLDYDYLILMQKVEVFEYVVNNIVGDDLVKLLWLKSFSFEVWFD